MIVYLTIKVELDIGDKSPEDVVAEFASECDYDVSMESDDVGIKVIDTELMDCSAICPI